MMPKHIAVGRGGRLPTEAQWEYSARAGSTAARYGNLDEIAWYANNSGRQHLDIDRISKEDPLNYGERLGENGNGMHEVGQKRANGFGLYDVLGNASEWVKDWYDEKYYQISPYQDPAGPASGQYRVTRGGDWGSGPGDVDVSGRGQGGTDYSGAMVGVRCVVEVAGEKVAASHSPTAASWQPPKPRLQRSEANAQIADEHYNNGLGRYLKGDLDGAMAEFREAIRIKPDFAEHEALGVVLESRGDFDGAIAEYREEIRLKPDYAQAYYNLGAALEHKGQLQDAMREYHRASELDPHDQTFRNNYERLRGQLSQSH